ncbi:hypothetical protein [Kribbella sp. NPDC049227]|uniref:hypothetical protein n=1 Tax=Kribbella sp. NPDC049227 TaxID=3364113 RepID=UPI0037113B65
MDWVVAVVPLFGVLTALAVWFGFQIVSSRVLYFGIDPSVLGFSTADFVLRSVAALLRPMVYLLVGILAVIWLHVGVTWLLRRGEHGGTLRRRRGLQTAGALAIVVGSILVVRGASVYGGGVTSDYSFGAQCEDASLGHWWRPLVLPTGVVLIIYGSWLLRQLAQGASVIPPAWHRLMHVVASALVLVGTFWSFSLYAHAAGALESHGFTCHGFDKLAGVAIYSTKPLDLPAEDGLEALQIGNTASKYRWQYSGLRLLIRSDDRYFLLPKNWRGQGDAVIVLADTTDLRFEFSPPGVL